MKTVSKTLLATFIVSLVVACGGANNGTPNSPMATLRLMPPIVGVVAPVGSGWSEAAEIRGGTKPYGVVNSAEGLEAKVTDDGVLMIRGRAEGEAGELSVFDNSAPVQQVKVKAETKAVPMVSSDGTTINLVPDELRRFNVMGGVAPYRINNSDASVATVSISGSTVMVRALSKSGDAVITITDATGKTNLAVTVKVQVSTLTASPANIIGSAATSRNIRIFGGIPPYTAVANNASLVGVPAASIADSGASITVDLKAAGTTQIIITDSTGQSFTVSVTVNSDTIKIAPENYDVDETYRRTILRYMINGGTAPYTPMISLANQLTVDVSIAGKELFVRMLGCIPDTGDRVIPIDVYDANLMKQTATLTIKNVAGTTNANCPAETPPVTPPVTPASH